MEDKALRYVAKAADGSMRDALSLIDQCVAFHLGQDELTYENVLDVLGAVDTTVFADTLKAVVSGDVSACLRIVEDVVMQGRDLSQFTSDFVWYLRNLLLVASTKDISSLEDVIDVSADNLKQLSEDAKLVDTETLMRYIRVMSDLSNELKLATQKRIKLEVSLIKMCKPAMEPAADVGELSGRVGQLEQQLEDALRLIKETESKIADGTLIPAGYGYAGVGQQPDGEYSGAVNVQKKVVQALPDDIKQIAVSWDDIVSSISDPLLLTFLRQANVALASDGASLEIVLKSTSAYNSVSREEVKEQLIDLIEERTGLKVNIIVTKLPDGDDFQNRFTDIRQQVNIDIVVDDKEEYI